MDDFASKLPMPPVNKNRCFVEDYMSLNEKVEVTVLIPNQSQRKKFFNSYSE